MPDIALSSAEIQKAAPSNAELLAFGHKEAVKNSALSPEQQKTIEDAKKKAAEGKGKEGIRDALGATSETRFTSLQAQSLREKFGGGKAKLNSDTNEVEIPTTAAPSTEERASFDSGNEIITTLSSYLDYIEIPIEMARTGESLAVVLGKHGMQEGQYKDLRDKALRQILSQTANVFEGSFVNTDGTQMSEPQKLTFIENTLATDPIFRNGVAKRLKEVSSQTDTFPDVSKDDEVKNSEEEQKQINQTLLRGSEYLLRKLASEGHPVDDPNVANELKQMVQEGRSPQAIITRLQELTVNQTPHAEDFRKIPELQRKQEDLRKQLELLNKTKQPNEAQRNQISNLQAEYNTTSTNLNSALAIKNANPTDFANFEALSRTFSLVGPDGQPTEVGKFLGGLYAAKERYHELDQTIREKQAEPGEKARQSRTARLIKESEQLDVLGGIIANAAADALEARYDAVTNAKSEALKKEKEKTMTAEEKKIEAAKDKRWISYDKDTREKTVNRGRVTADMRTLAYQGPDGLKRLLLRELGWKYKGADGQEIAINDDNVLNIDLEASLSDEQKKHLEEIYQKQGNTYREKLMTDFFLARSLGGRLKDALPGSDKMGLNDHEWQLLEKNFGGTLTEAMNKSKEYKRLNSRLEAAGIKPDFKTRTWLFALIAALGIGAVTTLGIAPIAVAGAAGAKTVGGAVWQGTA